MKRFFFLAILLLFSCKSETKPKNQLVLDLQSLEGSGLYFSAGEIDGDRLELTVSGRGLERVTGFAIRLAFDPQVLRFVEFTASSAWSQPQLAAAVRENQVITGIAQVPETGGLAFTGQAVGTYVFEILSKTPTSLQFVPDKTAAVDVDGARMDNFSFAGADLR